MFKALVSAACLAFAGFAPFVSPAHAADAPADGGEPTAPAEFYIQEYRVEGTRLLPQSVVEAAVYPFLGPGRTAADIEQARAALLKAYQDAGWQTVSVNFPSQNAVEIIRDGVVLLQVNEAPVGRLRVTGAKYFSPAEIKALVPSLAEGTVPNFNAVQHDFLALSQLTDLRVSPAPPHPDPANPSAMDFTLEVQDSPPVHASLELNNRYSAGTTPLRLNGAVSDTNLWQLGQAAGLSFQTSPEQPDQVKVFSGYYLVRPQGADGPALMLQGTIQDSNVSTLGGAAVNGRGDTLGLRAIFTLPSSQDFSHSVTLGFDYKEFNQVINAGGTALASPVTYYPFSADYNALWKDPHGHTDLNAEVVLGTRGLGSGSAAFATSRFGADESFIYVRGDLSRTQDLPAALQLYVNAQGQLASGPLLSAEQFSAGGLSTVRGYLEGEVSGDNGTAATAELRSPPFASPLGLPDSELRLYVFTDAAQLTVLDPLPQQTSRFDLASVGVGARIKAYEHFTGSLDLGLPLISQTDTPAHSWLITFTAAISY